jgi:uncharacterized protein
MAGSRMTILQKIASFSHMTLIIRATLVHLAMATAVLTAMPAGAQAPATAPAVAAVPLSDAMLALGRDVVVGSGLANTFEGMVPQIAEQIRTGYSRTRPDIIKDMEEALKLISTELIKQPEQMIDVAARLYAVRMSEAELKDAATFFKSAAGKKYVGSQGQILNELFTQMQVFSQTLGNVMIDRLREELRKKGHQI